MAKAVLIGAVPPLMLKTAANPGGLPMKCSTRSGPAFWRIARNSGWTSAWRSTVTTSRTPWFRKACGNRSGAGPDGRHAGCLFLHQGVLGNGPDRGSQEDRRADPDHARRRRPDRTDCRFRHALGQADQEGGAESDPGRAARHVHDPQERHKRGIAGLHPACRRRRPRNHDRISANSPPPWPSFVGARRRRMRPGAGRPWTTKRAKHESIMSHHLDFPLARQDIRLDITDLYVFRGETGTVFTINVCHSIFGPIPAPGYHPEGMYEFKVDLDGDAVEDVTYRITFDERDADGKQRFVLRPDRGRRGCRSECGGHGGGAGHHRRKGHHAERPAHLGRQGRRSVLDRARRAARGRPRISGRHGDRPVRLGSSRRRTCLPATRCIPSCWKYPTRSCSPEAASGGSACGRWRHSRPTPAAGARSTAWACR